MKPKLYDAIGILFLCALFQQFAFADFALVCPPDVTISCREDYFHDLNLYGKAYTDHNGHIQYLHVCKTTIEIDDCGKGTITRKWQAENPENWQWLFCMQVITIHNLDGFEYTDIEWPLPIVLESCDPEADLKNLTYPYEAPKWSKPKCAKPMVSFKDTRYRVHAGCEKLLREWKVLDWCQYDPVNYPGRGIFSYTQVIKLIHSSSSVNLLCKKDTVVFNNRTCDTMFVQLDDAVFEAGCPIYHRIYNNSKFAIDSGANASGYYPIGVTKFYYIAEYACGEEVKCEVTVDVRSTKLPTPYCLTGVILTLMPVDANNDGTIDDGMIELWASDLDKGSWHFCPKQKLNFSFSKDVLDRSRIYTCKDVGSNEIEIWVTDTLGNQDLCKTTVIVQNNNPNIPNCDGSLTGGKKSIKGKVVFYKTIPPPQLIVKLNSSALNMDADLNKNNNYEYEFRELDSNQAYNIESHCQSYLPSVLDFDDISYLKKIVDGKVKPASPYTILAADINQDHEINQVDYVLLKQVVYFKKFNLLNTNWIFIPESFTFSNPADPLHETMPYGINVQNLDHDMDNQNFVAIRIGDLVSKVNPESNLDTRIKDEEETSAFSLSDCKIENLSNGLSSIRWNFSSTHPQQISIQLLSIDGRQLLNKKVMLTKGIYELETEIDSRGLILYNVYNEKENISGKLFVGK
jgi:hypothetical protein